MKNINMHSFACLCVLLFGNISISKAESIFDDYSLRVGISQKTLDFEVTEIGNNFYSGSLTEGQYITYALQLNSPYEFIKDSNFGYYFEYGFYQFEMDYQVTNNGTVEQDLGTFVDGTSIYISPVLFYNIGDNVNNKKKHSLIIGMGVGIGYIDASGEIEFTETTSELFDIDIAKVDISFVALIEYHFDNWFIRFNQSGPSIREGNYDYDIVDETITFGYSIQL